MEKETADAQNALQIVGCAPHRYRLYVLFDEDGCCDSILSAVGQVFILAHEMGIELSYANESDYEWELDRDVRKDFESCGGPLTFKDGGVQLGNVYLTAVEFGVPDEDAGKRLQAEISHVDGAIAYVCRCAYDKCMTEMATATSK